MADTVSLKEYIEKILDDRDKYYERILIEREKHFNASLAAAERAVQVAERNAEKWRENANEWRAAMTDRENNFLKQETFNTYKEANEKALHIEKSRGDVGQGRSEGIAKFIGWIVAALAVLGFMVRYMGQSSS